MPAYVIVDVQVHNPEGYAEYRKLSGPSVEQYEGRFIVRGGAVACTICYSARSQFSCRR